MAECPVDCKNHPDSVEKINWKCVECKTDLKADFDRVIAERAAATAKAIEEDIASRPVELSEAEVKKRRDMYDE